MPVEASWKGHAQLASLGGHPLHRRRPLGVLLATQSAEAQPVSVHRRQQSPFRLGIVPRAVLQFAAVQRGQAAPERPKQGVARAHVPLLDEAAVQVRIRAARHHLEDLVAWNTGKPCCQWKRSRGITRCGRRLNSRGHSVPLCLLASKDYVPVSKRFGHARFVDDDACFFADNFEEV